MSAAGMKVFKMTDDGITESSIDDFLSQFREPEKENPFTAEIPMDIIPDGHERLEAFFIAGDFSDTAVRQSEWFHAIVNAITERNLKILAVNSVTEFNPGPVFGAALRGFTEIMASFTAATMVSTDPELSTDFIDVAQSVLRLEMRAAVANAVFKAFTMTLKEREKS